jgi:acetoin utilization protein AcuB
MKMKQEMLENLLVDEYTSICSYTGKCDDKVIDLMRNMRENDIRHLPIIQSNEVVGIVTDRELNLVINSEDGRELTAADVMVPEPFTVKAGTPLREVVFEMSNLKIGSVIVENFEDDYGIFTSIDALNALVEVLQE